jgi:hypothetical protein
VSSTRRALAVDASVEQLPCVVVTVTTSTSGIAAINTSANASSMPVSVSTTSCIQPPSHWPARKEHDITASPITRDPAADSTTTRRLWAHVPTRYGFSG